MQDILSFTQPKSPITLAPLTKEPVKAASSDGSFSESFFSIILGQFTQESKSTTQSELTQELPTTSSSEKALATTNDEAKSVDEHLLDDLLSVVNALQQNAQTTIFPTLKASSTLEKILGSETTRQDFANVKSVSDLMDLSKKYNLGLEKLSISQENIDTLQTKFPTLTQNNFFDDLQTALDAAKSSLQNDTTLPETTTATTSVINLLDKQLPKTDPTPVTSMLSELMSKEIKTEPKTTVTTTATDNTIDTTPITEEPLVVNEKQQTDQPKVAQTPLQKETVETTTAPLEAIIQKVVNTNETKKIETPAKTDASTTVVAVAAEPVQITPKKVNEAKIEVTKKEEDTSDGTLKTTKIDKTIDETTDGIVQTQRTTLSKEKEESTTSEDAQSTLDVKTDIKTTTKQDMTVKSTPVKESLNQFASDLKEKIEAYKPPIMKVELTLSPKNLGDVDVTLLTRGNNLHVNISSNTSTMSLFTQNQNDVKNALVNMGFTNLEMNFSDQRNSNQSQQNQKQSSGNFEEFTTEPSEEETASLEIVIPQYV